MGIIRWTIGAALLTATVLCCGCSFFGFLLSPTANEDVVPAQIRLARLQERGIVVIVDAGPMTQATPSLRHQLVRTINGQLARRARIKTRYLVAADDSSPERAKIETQLSTESPARIAQSVGAGLALYVHIEDFRVEGMPDEYMKGRLFCRAALVGTDGQVLWPNTDEPAPIRTQVEIETQGREKTIDRLVGATAHCIVRNFYDCPQARYRIAEETRGAEAFGW